MDAFGANRRDLLLHLAELHRGARGRSAVRPTARWPVGGRPRRPGCPTSATADGSAPSWASLGMDASRNLMDDHRAFLAELGVVTARRLRAARHGETVLVAGAKAATQTPPIRSGKRVIFTTLDDGTGLVDLAFFDDSHDACAHTVFHSWLLLVRGSGAAARPAQPQRGRVRPPGTSPNWRNCAREGGLDAVAAATGRAARAGRSRGPAPAAPGAPGRIRRAAGESGCPRDTRCIRGRTSARRAKGPPGGRKLWHPSPGSAG